MNVLLDIDLLPHLRRLRVIYPHASWIAATDTEEVIEHSGSVDDVNFANSVGRKWCNHGYAAQREDLTGI